MPVFSTLGAIAEFRQGYITPFPPTNANVTRLEGYNVNVAFTPNTTNTGGLVTYIATSNTGNFSGNTTGNVITIGNINPFYTYTFDVLASSAGGNSPATTTTNNVYMSSNLVANGNITYSANNLVAFDISPNGGLVYAVSSVGRFLRYSRNSDTGQLSLLGNSNITGYNTFNDIVFSADGNFCYITGGNTSNNFTGIINYNVAANTTTTTGNVGNVFGSRNIAASPDNKSIFTTGRYSNLAPFLLNYTRNTTDGNLSLYQSAILPNIAPYDASVNYRKMVVTKDNKNFLIIWQILNGNTVLMNYPRNTSNTYLNLASQDIDLSNALPSYTDLTVSPDNISVYGIRTDSVNVFSRNTSTGILTWTSNLTGYNNLYTVEIPANSIMLTGNVTFNRNLSNGNLTVESNSASYNGSSTISTVVSSDTKNLYKLRSNAISIFNITS